MPTGLERVRAALSDRVLDHLPICPILHTLGARLLQQPIGRYATDAACMAACVLHAYRVLGYDGLQLSLGVATEAEALGSRTYQPEDGLPVVVAPLLRDTTDLTQVRLSGVERAGRLPLFAEAVARVHAAVGHEAWVVATLRGPLLMATQLRGVEALLIDLLERPAWVEDLLTLTTQVGIIFGRALVQAGAHAIAIGEATCSPDFISPRLYRAQVQSHHRVLVQGLHAAGCEATLMHICGRAQPIIADVAATGSDVMDIDTQVDARAALAAAALAAPALGAKAVSMAVRGNIDPVNVLRYGTPEMVRERVEALCRGVGWRGRFILGSGCDVPPDTPLANVAALVRAGRQFEGST